MQTGTILIGVAILVATLPILMLPFRPRKDTRTKHASNDANAAEAHEAALLALRDLDFDHRTGKVCEEDYAALRAVLMAEAAQFIQKDQQQDDVIEALIEARRAGRERASALQQKGTIPSGTCPACGHKVLASDLFCVACGLKLEDQSVSA